jgi:cytochrome c biogenesis protein CcmG, thiol:disulfide interchange protein DsbE
MKRITIVMLLLSMLFLFGCGSETESGTGTEVGDQAYNFELEDYEGNEVKLSDFEGKTVYVLAWTTT